LHRHCLLKHVTEEKIERRIGMIERQGRKHKKLLDDLMEKTQYLKLKEALDCTPWSICIGRSYGFIVRETTK
jgi:hypothetical protein